MHNNGAIYRIGVVGDTHVPDRKLSLSEQFYSRLSQLNPDLIIHTGDITTPQVIRALEKISPVIAVRGNRDHFFMSHLPLVKHIKVKGVEITLLHGHWGFWGYVRNKFRILLKGYQLAWFLPRLLQAGPGSDVIVFGHSHHPINQLHGQQLLFNPGSPCVPMNSDGILSFGMLDIFEKQVVKGEIVPL